MVDKLVLNWFRIVQNFWKLYRFKVKLIFFTFPNLMLSGAIKQYTKSRIYIHFDSKGQSFVLGKNGISHYEVTVFPKS